MKSMPSGAHEYVVSPRASRRRAEALAFVREQRPRASVLVVAPARETAAELLRDALGADGAALGWRASGYAQLVGWLAESGLAKAGEAPAGALAVEAVAARAAFERARGAGTSYFGPVLELPGFPRALAATVTELRLAGVSPLDLHGGPSPAPDVAVLLEEFESQLTTAGLADRARLIEHALAALDRPDGKGDLLSGAVLWLDVPIHGERETRFFEAVVGRSAAFMATVPAGDTRTIDVIQRLGLPAQRQRRSAVLPHAESPSSLSRLQDALFAETAPADAPLDASLELFSAPGEGRESVEVARRILDAASQGVAFDEMAILLRVPDVYWGLLDHALRRARVPAYFSRGTRRPDPSGRALLALLACAAEQLSARRFAEYLSLGQVPRLTDEGVPAPIPERWVPAGDEWLTTRAPAAAPSFAPVQQLLLFDAPPDAAGGESEAEPLATEVGDEGPPSNAAAQRGSLRAPRRWEMLLAESGVIHGAERWRRRLDGLDAEYHVRLREARRLDPGDGVDESARVANLRRDIEQLEHLRRFALPLIDRLAALPARALWGEWIRILEDLVPQVLAHPDHVLRVIADLRPMARVGPVSLDEVRSVLGDRLTTTEAEPPADRYGRVFVGTPQQARGRSFRLVFVPGLAERLFPQRPRQDPLMLDELRVGVPQWLRRQDERAADERLLLRLAVGCASERVVVSYPRLDVQQSRARVPSFYALDVLRAATGRVPDHERIGRDAARRGDAWLAWPAPAAAGDAIDDTEYDLATLRDLLKVEPTSVEDAAARKGRARYLLELSSALDRSVRSRWARWRPKWSSADGLVRPGDAVKQLLAAHRPSARAYSVSALQRFAQCPYQFLLGAVLRLAPFEEPEPLERMDPLTKGALFHEVQRDVLRALQGAGLLPLGSAGVDAALLTVDEQLVRVAASYHDALAPAIQRVWEDEVEQIRSDLRMWVRLLADPASGWVPTRFEYSFGLPLDGQHDAESRDTPVSIGGRFQLRGAIDLIERRADGALRVTDHKTGRRRARPGSIIGGGEMLQPVIYSLAVEQALGAPVVESRLWYCTSVGEFSVHPVPLTDGARRDGLGVFEIIDRAVGVGNLPPAPKEAATCVWCDYRSVCGAREHERSGHKREDLDVVGDLWALRRMP